MSRLSTWLTVNESENFSAAYVPAWAARDCVVSLVELFCTRRRFLPEVPLPPSIPATLAGRLEDTKVAEETAAQLVSTDAPRKYINLTCCGQGGVWFLVELLIRILGSERSQEAILRVPLPFHFDRRKDCLPPKGTDGGTLWDLAYELRDFWRVKPIESVEFASILEGHDSKVRFERSSR